MSLSLDNLRAQKRPIDNNDLSKALELIDKWQDVINYINKKLIQKYNQYGIISEKIY